MSNTLIIYSTTDGQTVAICNTLVKNHNTDQIKICSIEDAYEENLNKYDKIIIGASIRYGKHNPRVIEFVKKNLERFNKIKTAFFSVNVVARKKNKNTPETNPYVKKFLNDTNWKPTKLSVFAGKVDYPSYRLLDKYIIRLIMWFTKGPTDVTKSYEFTNWDEVKKFGKVIKEM